MRAASGTRSGVEIYVVTDGVRRRVYTLAEASDALHVAEATLRQRVKRKGTEPAGWINPRLPVYYAADLGIPEPADDEAGPHRP